MNLPFDFLYIKANLPNAFAAFEKTGDYRFYETGVLLTRVHTNAEFPVYAPFFHWMLIPFFDSYEIYMSINSKKGKHIPSVSFEHETYFIYKEETMKVDGETFTVPLDWARQTGSRTPQVFEERLMAEFASIEKCFQLLEENLSNEGTIQDLVDGIGDN